MYTHKPVLLKEVINNLDVKPDGCYLDLTLGRGGHAKEILKKLGPNGFLFGIDKDNEAIEKTMPLLKSISNNFKLVQSDYKNFDLVLEKFKIKKVDGILIDLGVSSPQLDETKRGFSYSKDSYLDMRMDQRQKIDAHYIVNNYSKEELEVIFKNNAEVKEWKSISNAIFKNRPINTTFELVDVIKSSLPAFILRKKNPAKAVFQAIRIEVNKELEALETFLSKSLNFLNVNSKILIISFHSIEDRIVKKFFGNLTKSLVDPKMPINEELNYIVKTINVSKEELRENKRSRSSKLRILTKVK